jgi:hypothetical protein
MLEDANKDDHLSELVQLVSKEGTGVAMGDKQKAGQLYYFNFVTGLFTNSPILPCVGLKRRVVYRDPSHENKSSRLQHLGYLKYVS